MNIIDIIKRSKELHSLKGNMNTTIIVIDFFRSPNLNCTIQFADKFDNVSDLYRRRIYSDKFGQYFKIDNKKYYLKHSII